MLRGLGGEAGLSIRVGLEIFLGRRFSSGLDCGGFRSVVLIRGMRKQGLNLQRFGTCLGESR